MARQAFPAWRALCCASNLSSPCRAGATGCPSGLVRLQDGDVTVQQRRTERPDAEGFSPSLEFLGRYADFAPSEPCISGQKLCGGRTEARSFRNISGSRRAFRAGSSLYLFVTAMGPAVPPRVDSIQTVPGLVVPAALSPSRRLQVPSVSRAAAAMAFTCPSTRPVGPPTRMGDDAANRAAGAADPHIAALSLVQPGPRVETKYLATKATAGNAALPPSS